MALGVTPDGRFALSGATDRRLRFWDLPQGGEATTLARFEDWVTAATLTPDGRLALAGAADGEIRCWDLEAARELPLAEGHSDCVRAIAVSDDGRLALSAAEDGILLRWDLDRRTPPGQVARDANWITGLAISTEAQRVIAGHADGTVTIHDLDTAAVVTTLAGHPGPVEAVALSKDGRLAGSASVGHTFRLWDLSRPIDTPGASIHAPGMVVAAAIGGAGHVLAAWSDRLELRDAQGATVAVRAAEGGSDASAVAVTADGKRVICGTEDGHVEIWDLGRDHEHRSLEGHDDRVSVVAATSGGTLALAGGDHGALRLWDLDRGTELARLDGHGWPITAVAIDDDGLAAVSSAEDCMLRLWELEKECRQLEVVDFPGDAITAVALAPSGRLLVLTGWREGAVKLWDFHQEQWTVLGGHDDEVTAAAFAHDDRLAVTCSLDRTVRLWDLDSKRLRACFTADAPVVACGFTEATGQAPTVVACDAWGVLHRLRLVG